MDQAFQMNHKLVELEYSKKDGELEPGKYLVDILEFEPPVRFHLQARVVCRADDLDDGYERYASNGPYEKVLTYLSWQELANSWTDVDGDIRKSGQEES